MTCKECAHFHACESMLRALGYIIDGDVIDADKRCKDFLEDKDVGIILHGYWTAWGTCSECGLDALHTGYGEPVRSKYCPFCGARMEGCKR